MRITPLAAVLAVVGCSTGEPLEDPCAGAHVEMDGTTRTCVWECQYRGDRFVVMSWSRYEDAYPPFNYGHEVASETLVGVCNPGTAYHSAE